MREDISYMIRPIKVKAGHQSSACSQLPHSNYKLSWAEASSSSCSSGVSPCTGGIEVLSQHKVTKAFMNSSPDSSCIHTLLVKAVLWLLCLHYNTTATLMLKVSFGAGLTDAIVILSTELPLHAICVKQSSAGPPHSTWHKRPAADAGHLHLWC